MKQNWSNNVTQFECPAYVFDSGDVAYFDADGYFFIVDRMKELIKVKGLQVSADKLQSRVQFHMS